MHQQIKMEGFHILVIKQNNVTIAIVKRALQRPANTLRKKVLPGTYFWCFSLSQIEDFIQYLEGPNGIWKHHDNHILVQMD